MEKTDTERIDWLEKQQGCGLINDDNGHWAFVGSGFQNVPMGKKAQDISTTFFIEKKDWKPSIRKAIDAARRQHDRAD